MAVTSSVRRRPMTGLVLGVTERACGTWLWLGFILWEGAIPYPAVGRTEPIWSCLRRGRCSLATARAMQAATIEPTLVDTYTWSAGLASSGVATVSPHFDLGELWCIGVGSVGSCALFFLGLVTRAFHAVLVDRDVVKVENVTRSALFTSQDALNKELKVDVAGRWLNEVGVQQIEPHRAWLDEIPERWLGRESGTPDILISAANERNVRSRIEQGFPPLQVNGTTGRTGNPRCSARPLKDACPLCARHQERCRCRPLCATAPPVSTEDGDEDDVALPFLSYAAGLMTAAEIAKVSLTDKAVGRNRVFFEPRTPNLVRSVTLNRKAGCVCERRDAAVHEGAIQDSRFASLSLNNPK